MDYEGFSKERLGALHAEGRYRVFADLERRRGHHLVLERLSRHGSAPGGSRGDGASAAGDGRGRQIADLHGREAALIFTSGYVANDAALSTLAREMPGTVVFSDAL